MLYHVMKQAWYKVGLISTVFIDVGDWLKDNETHMTSLDHLVLRQLIKKAEQAWYTHIVLEVSSHALHQYRTRPLRFMWVACTNITREHLDFHNTIAHYASTKAELFDRVDRNGVTVLPSGFEYSSLFNKKTWAAKKYTFWYNNNSDVWVDNINQAWILSFDLHFKQKTYSLVTKIVGAFNAENMMIATLLADQVWVSEEDIVSWLSTFEGLPWRQELVLTEEGITAMIDFAVTPDGLSTLYTAIRGMWYKKIIPVFGATGNRDKGKRSRMWAVAGELCDITIITEDENYHEDGLVIMKEVEKWIQQTWGAYEMVQDRTEAIRRWLQLCEPWDIVVVTGMANYTTRCMNEWSVAWNEKEVIEKEITWLWYVLA